MGVKINIHQLSTSNCLSRGDGRVALSQIQTLIKPFSEQQSVHLKTVGFSQA